MKIKVEFDSKALNQKLQSATKLCQKRLDSQVLSDSNRYCPLDSSMLEKSSITNTVLGSGRLIWKTDYARKQYYDVPDSAHSFSKRPEATSKWFETAKSKRLQEWVKIVKNEYHENT